MINDILKSTTWKPNLDLAHPILPDDINGFSKWVLYGGFKKYYHNGRTDESHLGHDFISYLDTQGEEHFRLPPATPVRAVEDGRVMNIFYAAKDEAFWDYSQYLLIQHNETGLASGYVHVVPQVKVGESVKRGQVIATLYDTSVLYPSISLPTNLHFELGTKTRKYPFLEGYVDPLDILSGLREMSVRPVSPFPPHSR